MADKKLLEESTIRRFMKLANIDSKESGVLTEGNVSTPFKGSADPRKGSKKHLARKKMHEAHEMEEQGMYTEADEDPMGGMDAGLDAGDDVGGMDMGADDMDGMEGGDKTSRIESAVDTILAGLNSILKDSNSNKSVEQEPAEEDVGGEESDEEESEPMDDEGREEEMVAEGENEDAGVPVRNEAKKKHNGKKPMEEDALEESIELIDDSLVEKLLQRVTDRLVREARYSGHKAGIKQGAPFNKAAANSSKNVAKVNARTGTSSINNKRR